MTAPTVNEVDETEAEVTLTLKDRCDTCGISAAALTLWQTPSVVDGEPKVIDLMFCGSHDRRYEPNLLAAGFVRVVDNRQALIDHELNSRAIGSDH